MSLSRERVRQLLSSFDFQRLFLDELGWAPYKDSFKYPDTDARYCISAVADNHGVRAYVCEAVDGRIPEHRVRLKIDQEVRKRSEQHLVVYVDGAKTEQVWQWVRREPGRPLRDYSVRFNVQLTGERLIQRLEPLALSLEDWERESHVDATQRLKAFDVEKVTKRFYDKFKDEHDAFQQFIRGIEDAEELSWYVAVMLNRLMFIYFVQQKGFLDGDANYLHNRLIDSQKRGKDRYYNEFLCPLFFEGFARREGDRSPEARRLLGRVPYLNGGLFQRHQVEEHCGEQIRIPDKAFEQLFEFFGAWEWHLDVRPSRKDNEINPDVLGYIFEKYVNRKQMGAYYTKEDITGYIGQNTIIPFLLDQARKECRVAFEQEPSVWRLLQDNPDRYIYPAVRHGCDEPLPPEIAAGIKAVPQRTGWNRPAPEQYALPTEIWREVVARRQRYEDVWTKLVDGEVRDINDLITYNLDIRRFAQDVITGCEGPDLLRAFWKAIREVTVLDPTCGSGAFLFAALEILEPLYEACLERMQEMVDELERSAAPHSPKKYDDFRAHRREAGDPRGRRYAILKSIIVRNLYGVDIMEEAVEICRLRLFLKLVAQVERFEDIEPLPDIDFNIRAGNTLVGYASEAEVKTAIEGKKDGAVSQGKMDLYQSWPQIQEQAELAARAFERFQEAQRSPGVAPEDHARAKADLAKRLEALEDVLNQHLALDYGYDPAFKAPYQNFLHSHKPFHWWVEFYTIIARGGFDVIIGNPPYVEYKNVKGEYAIQRYFTEDCGNLYAFVVERSVALGGPGSKLGMIVPISLPSSQRMQPLRGYLGHASTHLWLSHFAIRPQSLFSGIMQRNTIVLAAFGPAYGCLVRTTNYIRWSAGERESLFQRLAYVLVDVPIQGDNTFPKVATLTARSVLQRLYSPGVSAVKHLEVVRPTVVYFHDSGESYWTKASWDLPKAYRNGKPVEPAQWFPLALPTQHKPIVFLLVNSNLAYWLWTVQTDCRHMTRGFLDELRIPAGAPSETPLVGRLRMAQKDNTILFEKRPGYRSPEMRAHNYKAVIDETDRVFAQQFGFNDEELDYIINYDIKYRMGADALSEEGDAEPDWAVPAPL